MIYHLNVANIKSNGCVTTICSKLDKLDGVDGTVVNISNGAVFVEGQLGLRDIISASLLDLGYPEMTSVKINHSFTNIAKSFVSCVKGRLRHLSTETN